MSKKFYRYYGGLLSAQENWLNKMASKGYRLIRSEKMLYEFEECTPGQYQYRIEFIGQKSKENAACYRAFVVNRPFIPGVLSLIALTPTILCQVQMIKVKCESKIKEW